MAGKAEMDALKQIFQSGLDAITRRMDEAQQLSKERHAENVVRLTSIEYEAKKTNGRVSQLEAAAKLADQWPSLKTWLVIVGGTLGAGYFVFTQLLGYVRQP